MVELKLLEAKCFPGCSAKVKGMPRPAVRFKGLSGLSKCSSGDFKLGIEKGLCQLKMEDFKTIATRLKNPSNTVLRLYNCRYCSKEDIEPLRFGSSDKMIAYVLQKFFRVLGQAVGTGGWLQRLELGFSLWKQHIRSLSGAFCCSSTLQHLSFADSALGDGKLQLLTQGLCGCFSLQILDLSGCVLTDSSAKSIAMILKVAVRRKVDAEWQSSLRGSGRIGPTSSSGTSTLSQGLTALDLSFNRFSDATSRQLCSVIRLGSTLEALNMQGNQLHRRSAQLFLSECEVWGVLRLVDLRNNLDGKDIGVLENGKHLKSFSRGHAPFWNAAPCPRYLYQDKLFSANGSIASPRIQRDLATSDERSSERIPTGTICPSPEEPSGGHQDQRTNVQHFDRRLFVNWKSEGGLDLLESNSRSDGKDLCHESSPLYSEKKHSNSLGVEAGDSESSPLPPPIDTMAHELTCMNHPNDMFNKELEMRTPPSAAASLLQSCQPAGRLNHEDLCRPVPRSEGGAEPPGYPKGGQLYKQKKGRSARLNSKHFAVKDRKRPARRPPVSKTELAGWAPWKGDRSNMTKSVHRKDFYRAFVQPVYSMLSHLPEDFTVEGNGEESEFSLFMSEMAKTLIHIEEGLNILERPSKA